MKYNKYRLLQIFVLFILFVLVGCEPSTAQKKTSIPEKLLFDQRWNLSVADTLVALPASLREISGVSPFLKTDLACIQDESAKIYFLDSETLELKGTHIFGQPDDYEAIACERNMCHVMTSEETLFRVPILNGAQTDSKKIGIKGKCETESLTRYKDGWLTICKSGQRGELFKLNEDGSEITQLFKVSTKDVYEFLKSAKPELMKRFTARKEWIHPSDIYYHSDSDHLYIVNGISKLLLSVDMKTVRVLDAILLDPAIFRQAEGITVDQKDRLLISSEGSGTAGIIARFNRDQ